MEMFCYQCQETMKGKACTKVGMCGKAPSTSNIQDLLVFASKSLAKVGLAIDDEDIRKTIGKKITYNLFTTITNANFDDDFLMDQVKATLDYKEELVKDLGLEDLGPIGSYYSQDEAELIKKAGEVGVLRTDDEDIRSLRELTLYGLKGLSAYLRHANVLGEEDLGLDNFIIETLVKLDDDTLSVDDLVGLTLETGSHGLEAMALLDKANTGAYGNPEITEVNIGVGTRPGILISGHDLRDLKMLLDQTKGEGVDVYTHSEMLPGHYYPELKKYDHFVGNYGGAWHRQEKEFASFNGPILMTTNCITPVKDEYKDRFFTTGAAAYPGCTHIEEDEDGHKDFSEIISLAKTCDAPEEIETGNIVGGFAHNQVLALADDIVEAVKSGAIKNFVVMAGCDGRQGQRSYYTDFAKALPESSVILTAGCAKYRYNKLDLGDIGGIPRVLDAGQCNDSYSLVQIALALMEVFDLDNVNDLPIVYNIAWYEQKAVIVLLALLSLGIKNIHLGPSLPAFLSENVVNVLVENFGISPNSTVEEDMEKLIGA